MRARLKFCQVLLDSNCLKSDMFEQKLMSYSADLLEGSLQGLHCLLKECAESKTVILVVV